MCDEMNGNFDINSWENYAANISKNLPIKLKKDIVDYSFDEQILPVLIQAIDDRDSLKKAHDAFVSVTTNMEEKFQRTFQTDLDVDIILYFGLCNGAGWATTLDGKSAILIGIEKVVELNWYYTKNMIGLIYHELGHILHDVKGVGSYEPLEQCDKSIWQLYREGIAMYCEQLLCENLNSYHQNFGDWLNWCDSHKNDILHEYKTRIHNNESTQNFFGDWVQWRGRSNLGYYLGCEFVKSLAQQYKLNALLNLNLNEIKKEFDKFAV